MGLTQTNKFKKLTSGKLLVRGKKPKEQGEKDPFLHDSTSKTDEIFMYEVVETLETDLDTFEKGDSVRTLTKANLEIFSEGDFIYYAIDPKAVIAIYEA